MRTRSMQFALFAFAAFGLCFFASGQLAIAQATSSMQGPVKITLDDAIQMALAHNHALLAARTTIQQSEAEEITANLRPNPVLLGDAQFLPVFQPESVDSNYFDNSAQFDLGVSYLFERGKKRQHRLQAAKDQTAVTRSTGGGQRAQPDVSGSVGCSPSVELAESALDLAKQDLKSFQNTVDISQDALQGGRHQRGRLSEDQAADAAVSDGRVAGAAREGAGAFGFAAIARIRIGAGRLRRGGALRISAGQPGTSRTCR